MKYRGVVLWGCRGCRTPKGVAYRQICICSTPLVLVREVLLSTPVCNQFLCTLGIFIISTKFSFFSLSTNAIGFLCREIGVGAPKIPLIYVPHEFRYQPRLQCTVEPHVKEARFLGRLDESHCSEQYMHCTRQRCFQHKNC